MLYVGYLALYRLDSPLGKAIFVQIALVDYRSAKSSLGKVNLLIEALS